MSKVKYNKKIGWAHSVLLVVDKYNEKCPLII
jgi:hypothetical protein